MSLLARNEAPRPQDSRQSSPSLEPTRLLLCKGVIALTTAFEIPKCKAIRKLDVGEVLEALGEPGEDEGTNLTRVQVGGTEFVAHWRPIS